MATVDMAATAMVTGMVATAITDMADTDTMATTARGRLRQLLWLLLSQLLLPSLATDTMADMATVATEAMVMDTAMDMVDMVTMATTARDLLKPTMATEDMEDTADTEDMVMAMVMAMATDTTDKREVVMVKSS